MPIESPVLDDLGFEDLIESLRRRIAVHTPEWTDHNESDPGLTLLQLFAFLGSQIGYRLNRVPDKNYIEFLKLIGMRLQPAESAWTRLALFLTRPELASAFAVPAGSRVKAVVGDEPPELETREAITAVPAQLAALVTTLHGDLRDLALIEAPAIRDPIADDADPDRYVDDRFELVWDGKTPRLPDMPSRPLSLFTRPSSAGHRHLWIGLAFNPAPPAGFVGQRASLWVQLDDDEQPSSLARALCGHEHMTRDDAGAESSVEYAYYRPARPGELRGSWQRLRPLSDTTEDWTRSGRLRFDVPIDLGPIPDREWVAVREEATKTTEQICAEASSDPTAVAIPEPVAHPLVGAIKVPVTGTPSAVPISGWLLVRFALVSAPAVSLRGLCFNVARADHASTASPELLGRGSGLPGQQFALANGNVLAEGLTVAVEDRNDGQLHTWTRVADFDAAGPLETVYTLDREAGIVGFGDGIRGFPPPSGARVVALGYRHGGGDIGPLPVATLTQPVSFPAPVSDVTNLVATSGGRDAETLQQAMARAPRELKTLQRAVTLDDYEFLARQTPGVNVARAVAIPLRRPLDADSGPGLDHSIPVPGVISVLVVPRQAGPFPTPTGGMLRTVCQHLDGFRLITTEVYVVPPQYVRLHRLMVALRARPGYSTADLRDAVVASLEGYYHVLRGGDDGAGFSFGVTVHHADLVARVFRTQGVDRVEELICHYDGRAPGPEDEPPAMLWRRERWTPGVLTGCPRAEGETDRIALAGDETVFIDSSDLLVRVIA